MQQSSGGGPWKHDPPKPSFSDIINLAGVDYRVRGIEIQSLVQYWIKTVCCRSKDHFRWTAPCTPCTPLVSKVGALSPTAPACGAHASTSEDLERSIPFSTATIQHHEYLPPMGQQYCHLVNWRKLIIIQCLQNDGNFTLFKYQVQNERKNVLLGLLVKRLRVYVKRQK